MAKRLKYSSIPSLLEKNDFISQTVLEIFKNLNEDYKRSKNVSDENLLALNSIFKETLGKALDLVESNSVSYFHLDQESIGVYQVEGSSGNIYTIFPSINYCPCQAFKYQVACGSSITCKHVLASVLACILNKAKTVQVTPSHFNDLLLSSANLK